MQPTLEAATWSDRHPIGTVMLYRPLLSRQDVESVEVRSLAWQIGHEIVVKVTGRTGVVSVRHLEPVR